jgi:hypothetical protein
VFVMTPATFIIGSFLSSPSSIFCEIIEFDPGWVAPS